jgi:hypothetical protein
VTCGRFVVFSGYSDFIHQENCSARYNWNIVENGVKHHKSTTDPPLQSDGFHFLLVFWKPLIGAKNTHYCSWNCTITFHLPYRILLAMFLKIQMLYTHFPYNMIKLIRWQVDALSDREHWGSPYKWHGIGCRQSSVVKYDNDIFFRTTYILACLTLISLLVAYPPMGSGMGPMRTFDLSSTKCAPLKEIPTYGCILSFKFKNIYFPVKVRKRSFLKYDSVCVQF